MKLACALILVAAASASASAQVGYLPPNSPFHDFPYRQELSVYGGYFTGSTGDAGVGPQSGFLVGGRWALRLGGPVDLDVHFARAFTQRLVKDPTQPPLLQDRGTESFPLYLADVGLTFNLTGTKSWHRLIPLLTFGAGVASDGGADNDVGGFKIGTPFTITFGTGVRYVPGGNWAVRLDVSDYMFQMNYPNSYFTAPSGGGASVLPSTHSQNQWAHNGVITLGLSYLYGR